MITKEIGERLNSHECLQLLDKAAEYGIIEREGNHLKLWHEEKGWQLCSMTACARVLSQDLKAQTYIRRQLSFIGVELNEFAEASELMCCV